VYALHLLLATSTSSAFGGVVDEREMATNCAITVNDALSSYIGIHNDLFKVKARRLIPILGVYEAIEFKHHVDTLARVDSILKTELIEIDSARSHGSGDEDVDSFLISLRAYSEALLVTVQELKAISSKLYEKSQSSSSYKWATYSEDIENYKWSISHYTELGGELNKLYSRMIR